MDVQSIIKPVMDVQDIVIPSSEDGWIPMDEEGLAFIKPLWTSPESGGWAVLWHWKKGYKAAAHKHLGSIHAYIIKGKLQVRDHVMNAGDYIYEANGVIHDETTAVEDTIHSKHCRWSGYFLQRRRTAVLFWLGTGRRNQKSCSSCLNRNSKGKTDAKNYFDDIAVPRSRYSLYTGSR